MSSLNSKSFFSYLVSVLISFFIAFNLSAGVNSNSDNKIYLLVRGDDMGLSHGVNLAFEKCFKQGIMTSVELMVPTPWFKEAVKILNENPRIDVGIHLDLTSEWKLYRWGPITHAPSLVDKDGRFFTRTLSSAHFDSIYTGRYSLVGGKLDMNEVEKELRAQIELALKNVHSISHLSSHMGCGRATSALKALTKKLAAEYGLANDMEFREHFIEVFRVRPAAKEDSLAAMLENLKPGFWYLVVHPGLNTPEMQAINAPGMDPDEHMSLHRAAVTNALISERIKKIIKKRNIILVNHRDVLMNHPNFLRKW